MKLGEELSVRTKTAVDKRDQEALMYAKDVFDSIIDDLPNKLREAADERYTSCQINLSRYTGHGWWIFFKKGSFESSMALAGLIIEWAAQNAIHAYAYSRDDECTLEFHWRMAE